MTVYNERNDKTILDAAVDADSDLLTITKVNGQEALVGVAIPISVGGTVTVMVDGTVSFDDSGFSVPEIGEYVADGLIATISDGTVEADIAVNLELYGAASAGEVVFGALTRPFEGGYAAPEGATSITGGDPEGHFAISDGMILPTLAGSGVLSGTYVLTLNTGATQMITILPDTFSVSKDDELSTLLSDASVPFDGKTVQLREARFGLHTLPSHTYTSGVTIAADGPGTKMRQIYISACWGSPEIKVQNIEFSSDEIETSKIHRLYYEKNNTPNGSLYVEGCRFLGHPGINIDPDIWYAKLDYTGATALPQVGERIDNDGGGDNGAYTTVFQVHDNGDGTGTVYVDDSPGGSNGGSSDNQGLAWAVGQLITSDGGWQATLSSALYGGDDTIANGIEGQPAFTNMYVEGNNFDRLNQALKVSATQEIVVRGNIARNQRNDFIKTFAIDGVPPTTRTLIERNVVSQGMCGSSDYGNPHRDGIQVFGSGMSENWQNLIVRDNIFWTGQTSRVDARANSHQCIWFPTKSSSGYGHFNATIANNICDVGGGLNAIVTDYSYSSTYTQNMALSTLQRVQGTHSGGVRMQIGYNGTDNLNTISNNITESLLMYGSDVDGGNVTSDKFFDFSAYFPAWDGLQDFSDITNLFSALTPGAGTAVMAGSTWVQGSDHGCINEAGRFIGHDGSDLTDFFLDLEASFDDVSSAFSGSVPAAFSSSDWSLSDDASGGTLVLTINSLPSGGGFGLIDLEYRIDGGAYVSLGNVALGDYPLTGLSDDTTYTLDVRAVNSLGAGPASDSKSATPSFGGSLPAAFSSSDWSLADDATGGTLVLTITGLPSDGNLALTDLQYRIDGGGYVSLGSVVAGDYPITGLSDDTTYTLDIRAVNSLGAGPASDSKSAVPSTASSVPGDFTLADWSLVDAGTGGTVNVTITTLPDAGSSPITDLGYTVDGGSFVSLGSVSTGSYAITGLSDDVEVQIGLQAQNAQGVGAQGPLRAVTPTGGVALDESFAVDEPTSARMVYDRNKLNGGNAADIPVAVTGASPNTALEARAIDSAGLATSWVSIGTTDGAGDLSSTIADIPAALNWYKWQVRKAATPSEGGTTAGEFGVGDVIAFFGQSPLAQSTSPGPTRSFTSPEVLTVTGVVEGVAPLATVPITQADSYNEEYSYLSEMVAGTSDCVAMFVDLAHSGTGRWELADDANTGRQWADLTAIVQHIRDAGSEIGLIYETWHTADGPELASDPTGIFLPFYTGVDAGGNAVATGADMSGVYNLDHMLFDLSGQARGLFNETRTKMVYATPFGNGFTNGMNNFLDTDGVLDRNRLLRHEMRDKLDSMLATTPMQAIVAQQGPYSNNVMIQLGGTIHLEENEEFGRPHILRNGFAAAYLANGVISDDYSGTELGIPEITGVTWSQTHIDVQVSIPAGRQLTTTRIARGMADIGTAQPHYTEVMGFEFAQNLEHSLLPSGFSAVIHDASAGIIRITPDAGVIENGARLTFADGQSIPVLEDADKTAGSHLNMPIVTCGAGGGYEGLPLKPQAVFWGDNIAGATPILPHVRSPIAGFEVEVSEDYSSDTLTMEFKGSLTFTDDKHVLVSTPANRLIFGIDREGDIQWLMKSGSETTLFNKRSPEGTVPLGYTMDRMRQVHLVASIDRIAETATVWLKDEAGVFQTVMTPSFTDPGGPLIIDRAIQFGKTGNDAMHGRIEKLAVWQSYTNTPDTSVLGAPYALKEGNAASWNATTNAGTGPEFINRIGVMVDA